MAGAASDFESLHGHKANRKVRFFCLWRFTTDEKVGRVTFDFDSLHGHKANRKVRFFLFYGVSIRMRRWAGVAFDFESLHGHKANRNVRFFCFVAFHYG